MVVNGFKIGNRQVRQSFHLFWAIDHVQAQLQRITPGSHTIQPGVQVGIADEVFPLTSFQGISGEFFKFCAVFVAQVQSQVLSVLPISHQRHRPGSDFTELQLSTIEGRIYLWTQVRPKNRESLAVKAAAFNGFFEQLRLRLDIKPPGLLFLPG